MIWSNMGNWRKSLVYDRMVMSTPRWCPVLVSVVIKWPQRCHGVKKNKKTRRFSLATPFRPGKTNYNYGRWINDKQLLETRTNWQFRKIRQTRHRRRLIRVFVWLFTSSVGFQGSPVSNPSTTASALSLPTHVFFLSYNLYLSSFYLLCSREWYLRLTRTYIKISTCKHLRRDTKLKTFIKNVGLEASQS